MRKLNIAFAFIFIVLFYASGAYSASLIADTVTLTTDADGNGKVNIGDTITITVEADTSIYTPAADLSSLGGSSSAAMTTAGTNVYTTSILVSNAGSSGADATNPAVKVTLTTGVDSNVTIPYKVDSIAPAVSSSAITLANSTLTNSGYTTWLNANDVLNVQWNSSGVSDVGVCTAYLSPAGGPATVMTDIGGGIYQATYTILSGDTSAYTLYIYISVTDDDGNETTFIKSGDYLKFDNQAPETSTLVITSAADYPTTKDIIGVGEQITISVAEQDQTSNELDDVSSLNATVDLTALGSDTYTTTESLGNKASNSGVNSFSKSFTVYRGSIEDSVPTSFKITLTDDAGNKSYTYLTVNDTNNSKYSLLDNRLPTIYLSTMSETFIDNDGSGYANIGDQLVFQAQVSADDGETKTGNITIDVTSIGYSAPQNTVLVDYDASAGTATIAGTYTISAGALEDESGASNFTLSVKDNAANETTADFSILVDNTPPAYPDTVAISDTTLSTVPGADNSFTVSIKTSTTDVNSNVANANIVVYTDSNILSIARKNTLTGDTSELGAFSYNGDSWVSSSNILTTSSNVDGKDYFFEVILYDNAGNTTVYYDTTLLFDIDSQISLGTTNKIYDKTDNTFDDDDTHPVMSTSATADDTFYVQVSVQYPSPQTGLSEEITSIAGYLRNAKGSLVSIIETGGAAVNSFSSETNPSMPSGIWTSPDLTVYNSSTIDGFNYYIEYILTDAYGNTVTLNSPAFDIDSTSPEILDWWPNSDTLTSFSPADLKQEIDLSSSSLNNDPANPDNDQEDFVFYFKVTDSDSHLNYTETEKTFSISSNINSINDYYQNSNSKDEIYYVINNDGSNDPLKIPGSYNMRITVYDKAGNYVSTLKSFEYDNEAPTLRSTTPANGAYLKTALDSVVVVIYDYTGDIDMQNSTVYIEKSGSKIAGTVTYETELIGTALQATYTFKFSQKLLTTGDYDGQYSIVYDIKDLAGNKLNNEGQNNLTFIFDSTAPTYSGSNHPVPGQIVTAGDLADVSDINNNGDTTEDYVLANVFDKTAGIDFAKSDIVIYRIRDGVKVGGINNPKFNDKLVAFFDNLTDTKLKTDGSDDGRYNQLIHLWDKAGNFTTITQPFIYDTQKPVINDLADASKIYFAVLNENEDVSVDIKIYNSQIALDDYTAATILNDLKDTADDVLVKTFKGISTSPGNNTIYWDGKSDGGGLLDINKVYRYEIVATDIAGNLSDTATGYIIIDKQNPVIANVKVDPNPFTPTLENVTFNFTTNENCAGYLKIYDADGTLVENSGKLIIPAGVNQVYTWSGINTSTDEPYSPGEYKFVISATDKAGNDAENFVGHFEITQRVPTIKSVSVKPNPFSPNSDGVEDSTTISVEIASETYTETKFLDYGKYKIVLQFQPLLNTVRIYKSSGASVNLEDTVYFDNSDSSNRTILIADFRDTPLSNLGDTYTIKYTARNKISVVAKIFDLSGKNELRTLYHEDKNGDGILDSGEDENKNGYLDNDPQLNAADSESFSVDFVFNGKYKDTNLSDNEPPQVMPEGDYIYRIYTIDKQLNVQTIVKSGLVNISYSSLSIKIVDFTISPEKFIPDGNGVDDYANIGYTLNKDAYVNLKIYNSDLVLIKTLLLNQYKTAGAYKEFWDGTDETGKLQPSGDYIVKIIAADVNTTEADQLEKTVTIGNTWLGDYTVSPTSDSNVNYVENVYYTIINPADTGIDLGNSSIILQGPAGEVNGIIVRKTDGSNSIIELDLNNPLSTDGTADGEYNVILNALKKSSFSDSSYTGPSQARIVRKFVFDSRAPKITAAASGNDSNVTQYTNDLSKVSAFFSDVNGIKKVSGLMRKQLSTEIGDSPPITYSNLNYLLSMDTFSYTGTLFLLFAPDGTRVKGNDASNVDDGKIGISDINLPKDGTADGTYTLVIIPKDKAGNAGARIDYKFIYDTKKPNLNILIDSFKPTFNTPAKTVALVNDNAQTYYIIDKTKIPITITATEALGKMPDVTVRQYNDIEKSVSLTTADSKTWSGYYTMDTKHPGTATVTIYGYDKADNKSPVYTTSFVFNAPTQQITNFSIAPNPFNPALSNLYFNLNITQSATVSADIYTLNGEFIKHIEHYFTAGPVLKEPNLSWDGRTFDGLPAPAGLYIYLLKIKGDKSLNEKGICVLIRK